MTIKLGWPYTPAELESRLLADAAAARDPLERESLLHNAKNVRRGGRILSRTRRGLEAVGRGTRRLGTVVDRALAPAGAGGRLILRGAGTAGEEILNTPGALGALGTVMLTAPIISRDAEHSYNNVTEGILNARQDPRTLVEDPMLNLDSFLEKKSALFSGHTRGLMRDTTLSGFGAGIGSELAKGLVFGTGQLLSSAGSALFGNSKKQEILRKLLASDQIIADAVKRNPAAKEQMLEAYATLERFAPTLAADINAVRSFLREVVLGGGHVNYATIKNLVETEKAMHSHTPKYEGLL